MRILTSIILAALVCSCQAKEPCNQDRALRIATAHAKAHPIVPYHSEEKMAVSLEGTNYKVDFYKPGFGIGGGLTVWVDRSTCKISQSLFGQ